MCSQVVSNTDRGIASMFVIMNSCGQINSPYIPNYEEGELKVKQAAGEYTLKCNNVCNIGLLVYNAILHNLAVFHTNNKIDDSTITNNSNASSGII